MSEAINVPIQQLHHTFDSEIELTLDNNLEHQLNISTPINNNDNEIFKSSYSPTLEVTDSVTIIEPETVDVITNSLTSTTTLNETHHNFVTKIKSYNNNNNNKYSISFLHAVFDNIVGPKCIHFWSTHLNEFNNYLLKYIAVHTLNGELYNQEKLINNFKFRFYSIKEINYSILTIFFDANTIYTHNHQIHEQQYNNNNNNDGLSYRSSITSLNHLNSMNLTVLNCFSIIVPIENQQYLFDKSDFIINSFENYILEFRVFAEVWEKINNVTRAVKHLETCIDQLCMHLSILENRGIKSINLRDTYFYDIETQIDKELLISSITSHLITNMNTIVIGTSSTSINKMIATLGFLMPKEKLAISCYSLPDQTSLSPYFCLQGFVSESFDDLNLILNTDIIFTKNSPTTIIDLSSNRVYRTPLLHDFTYCKEIYIERKLKFYYNSLKKEDLLEEWPVNTLIKLSTNLKSLLIDDLLKQIGYLEVQFGLREAYIDLFIKNLNLSALTLIEYVNNEIAKNNQNNNNVHKAHLCVLSIKKLQTELSFKNEDDLYIILSFANNLKCDFSMSFQLKS